MNKNPLFPITKIGQLRELILWFILSSFSWFILSIFLNVMGDNNELVATPQFAFFWLYGWATLFIARKINKSENLKKFILKSPIKQEIQELILMAFQLFAFSICSFILLYNLLTSFAPSMTKLLISDTSSLLTIDFNISEFEVLFKNIQILMIGLVFAPFIEEFVFRGVLLQNLNSRWGIKLAVISTSLMFACLHTDIIGKFVFGIVMSILYLKTGKLLVPIICHMLNNLFSLSLIGLQFIAPAIEFQDIINNYIWLNSLLLAIVSLNLLFFLRKNWVRLNGCSPEINADIA